MFGISTLKTYLSTPASTRRPSRRTELRPCPDQLEGRELMAPFAGQFFAQRYQQARLMGVGLGGRFRTNAAVFSPTAGTLPSRIVRDPALISPVDPFGQVKLRGPMQRPFAFRPVVTPAPVSAPSAITPADPQGQFTTQAAVLPTAANPNGGPSTPVYDPSLISPVDPYGRVRLR